MLSVLGDSLWQMIEKLARRAPRKLGAVAYLTSDARVRFKRGDVLVVDASDAQIKGAATSALLLKTLLSRGVELYSFESLHAKVLVLGDVAVIGSANLTTNSENLVEVGVLTDMSPRLRLRCMWSTHLRAIPRRGALMPTSSHEP